jgi:hypothetical protein
MTPVLRGVSLLAIVALVLAPRSWGGEKEDMSKPGPEHKLLASLAGAYEAKVKAYFDPSKGPDESTGTMERKLIMGGRFLQEKYEGKAMGQPFFGMGIMGYDKLKKKYTAVWIDTMTTSIMHSLGTYDADKKTFTYVSDEIDPYTGKKMKTRDVLKIVSDKEQLQEMFSRPSEGEGPEMKMLEIRYTRKK